jgi:hypothetical protein
MTKPTYVITHDYTDGGTCHSVDIYEEKGIVDATSVAQNILEMLTPGDSVKISIFAGLRDKRRMI